MVAQVYSGRSWTADAASRTGTYPEIPCWSPRVRLCSDVSRSSSCSQSSTTGSGGRANARSRATPALGATSSSTSTGRRRLRRGDRVRRRRYALSVRPKERRMHAHDEDVSYTRIIEPTPTVDDLPPLERADHPQLVWRPRLGEQVAYPLTGRMTRLGRHDEN